MPVCDYEIGTILGGESDNMTNVEELLDPSQYYYAFPPPIGMAVVPFSTYHTAISGVEYGDGFPTTAWRFPVMTTAMWTALIDAYLEENQQSAYVYIKTREVDGTYNYYQAIMHRPKIGQEAQWDNGVWRDVTIRFTRLIKQEVS